VRAILLIEVLKHRTKNNWVSEPHASGVSEKPEHAVFARLREAELSGRHEHSPIPSPLTPPLENANEHVKLCFGMWFERCCIHAPSCDLSGSSEAKTTTFAHPHGLKQHRSISKYCDILIY